MTAFYASYVPIVREDKTTILFKSTPSGRLRELKVDGALELVSLVTPKDELYLMMGSTNAALALGTFNRGVRVFQLSYVRAKSFLTRGQAEQVKVEEGEETDEEETQPTRRKKLKVSPEHVYQISQEDPELFYPTLARQSEILEIMNAWDDLARAMKTRIQYANTVRSHLQRRAVIAGKMTKKELDEYIEQRVGLKDPQDLHMKALLAIEQDRGKELDEVMNGSGLYEKVFVPIEGIGPRLAARVIAGIERIERFPTADDLIRFGGFLPQKGGKLPSKKRGVIVNRSPKLNNAGFMIQDQLTVFGANSEYGLMLKARAQAACPSTKEQRAADKALRSRYGEAMKQARIYITRVILERIYRDWSNYMGLPDRIVA